MIVTSGGERFAIPQVSLLELVRLEGGDAIAGSRISGGAPVYRLRGNLLPLVHLDRMLGRRTIESSAAAGGDGTQETRASFEHLREMHIAWKGRLERFLNGQEHLDPDKLASPDECELGRWLNDAEIRQHAEHPEFAELVGRGFSTFARVLRDLEEGFDWTWIACSSSGSDSCSTASRGGSASSE